MKLLRSVYKRDNIKMKLRELGIPDQQSKEILNTIFGYQESNKFFTELVDATDVHDFKEKLQTLKAAWDEFCPGFYKWFVKTSLNCFAHP